VKLSDLFTTPATLIDGDVSGTLETIEVNTCELCGACVRGYMLGVHLRWHESLRRPRAQQRYADRRQPACGNLKPHGPHNGFAVTDPAQTEPWCVGVKPVPCPECGAAHTAEHHWRTVVADDILAESKYMVVASRRDGYERSAKIARHGRGSRRVT
jgi:hypothetical protein